MKTQERQQVHTNGWGIDQNYEDAAGEWHEASQESIDAILRAMKAEAVALSAPLDHSVLVVRGGEQHEVPGEAMITLESGETIAVRERLPADLPRGYHALFTERSEKACRLIVGPAQCWLPEQLETWGWAVQLYAARSRRSWGMGDLADMTALAEWSAKMGAGMMLVNPLSAAIPIPQQQASPYYPSSRRFFSPLWLNIESIPGSGDIPNLEELAAAGRALNGERRIARDRVYELKMKALNALWLCFKGDGSFTKYCNQQGRDLEIYGTYCALAEREGSGWHTWPRQWQHPHSPAVSQFAEEHRNRIEFHKWVQWLIDLQMARASEHLALMQDLPIGVDPDGADSWAWQDILAQGASVGAPPDEFNTQGQNWGLPPYIPHKLREAGYEPFIQTVRAAMRNAGGLRVDHVMGLFRLFWIPDGMNGSQGAYVRYAHEDLLTIVALESERARAYVVGEDLGTVEEEARRQLTAHKILSYRLLWFEKDEPHKYPREALAAITTHDLPTVAGLWTGSDLARQKAMGLEPNEESTQQIHQRLAKMAKLEDDAPLERVIEQAYGLLAGAPSRILTAALDDAAAVEERPNVPATTVPENWSMALPVTIEELMEADLPLRIGRVLNREREMASLT